MRCPRISLSEVQVDKSPSDSGDSRAHSLASGRSVKEEEEKQSFQSNWLQGWNDK